MSIDTSRYVNPFSVNTFSYCPRRWYIQDVFKFFSHNEHTLIGRHVHERREEINIQKRSEVYLVSHKWHLKGKCDYIETEDKNFIPVEVKKSRDKFGVPIHNDIMQLVCYALMIEDVYNVPVTTGFLIYAGSRKKYEISIKLYHKSQLNRLLRKMDLMKNLPEIPKRLNNKNRCWNCSIHERCLSTREDHQ